MHEPAPIHDTILGRRVGNHRVERKLGQGGMGSVYLLRHVELPDTFVALKVLGGTGGAGATPEIEERFRQEAHIAAAIGSHRVVKPLDLGRFDDGVRYILMEYVPGRSLAEELRRSGPLPVATALTIACRVADTMVIAHQKGILHRDLKPLNIMLVREGERDHLVRLLDFGVARPSQALRMVCTAEHVVIGTPGYLSPEAALALPTDGRTDVFSLGVVLFEMLAGQLPFPVPSVDAALMNVLSLPAPGVASLRPPHLDPVPRAVEELVARALAKEPTARLTMADLRRALEAALEGISPPQRSTPGPRRPLLSVAAPLDRSPENTPTLCTPGGRIAELVRQLGAMPGEPAPTRIDRCFEQPTALRRGEAARAPRDLRHLALAGFLCAATIVVAFLAWCIAR